MNTNTKTKVSLSFTDCQRINKAASEGKLHKMVGEIKRGQIFIADLGVGVGCEQQGIRPVLIVQNDVGNRYSRTVAIVPITSASKKNIPTHLKLSAGVGGLNKESTLIVEQTRTIDKDRLVNYIGALSNDVMKEVNKRLVMQLGIE